MEARFTAVILASIATLHPLLDPFAGSRDDAVRACVAHVRAGFPLAGRVAERWPGGVGRQLAVVFAWFQCARALEHEPNDLVRERGFARLRATLDGPLLQGTAFESNEPAGALGLALAPVLREHEIAVMSFAASLEEHLRGRATGAFSSRRELVDHAGRLVHAEALAYARILGAADDRGSLLARALGEGLQLVDWLVHAQKEFRAGRLRFAADDVARSGVVLRDIERGESSPATSALSAAHAEWAGGLMAKGWPLCFELGWARGRVLAAILRWHVAELSALEARDFRTGSPPPAGWLRAMACTGAALITRRRASW